MDWILVICVGLSQGICEQKREAPYQSLIQCNEQRDAVAKQRAVSFAYCRPAREPELVK